MRFVPALLALCSLPAAQTVWIVDASTCPGPGAGTLAAPFCTIGQAVGAAASGDVVLVRPGVYPPFACQGIALTIKSDLDGLLATYDPDPFTTVIDGAGSGPVVIFNSSGASLLEGFTVANGFTATAGGGISCLFSAPTIRGNRIVGNVAMQRGGGIYSASSSPTIEDNLIADNQGGLGGGIYHQFDPALAPSIRANTIQGNHATVRGGALYLTGTTCPVEANQLVENTAVDGGGAIWCESNGPIRANLIAGNATGYGGGGLFVFAGASPLVENNLVLGNRAHAPFGAGGGCLVDLGGATTVRFRANTFVGNTATQRGGDFVLSGQSKVDFANGILWGSAAPVGPAVSIDPGCVFTVTYSDVQGGVGSLDPPGAIVFASTNISAPPLFASPAGPDGDGSTWEDNDYHLRTGSPCIDTANGAVGPNVDIEGDPRPIDGDFDGIPLPDMGADEWRRSWIPRTRWQVGGPVIAGP